MSKLKKIITSALITSLSLTMLTGFTNKNNSIDTNNVNNSNKINKILWEYAGKLPNQKGYKENIGVAGVLYGKINDYIIVGGGANFPEKSVLEGGSKKTYPDVYLLKVNEDKIEFLDQIQLPFEIAYGSSVSTKDGIYYIGGSTNKENANDITLFTVESGKLKYKKIGDLPFSFSDGIAVEHNNILYIGFGKQDGKPNNRFISFDLKTNFIKELNTIKDNSVRNQAIAQVLNNDIYLFSGGGDTINTDGYKYNIDKNSWQKVSDVMLDNKKISLYGATSIKLNDDELLVIGGFDKKIYDNAVKNLNTLKDEELQAFRQKYFTADPYKFNWNKEILIYNAKEDKWKTIGKVPFDAPCGAGLIFINNKIICINGEIKPGVRTNSIYIGHIK